MNYSFSDKLAITFFWSCIWLFAAWFFGFSMWIAFTLIMIEVLVWIIPLETNKRKMNKLEQEK